MKKKEVITTRGIRFWSPIQVRIPQNRAQLCWADDTWCCPCGIVTRSIFQLRVTIPKGQHHVSSAQQKKLSPVRRRSHLDEWPATNTTCCNNFLFLFPYKGDINDCRTPQPCVMSFFLFLSYLFLISPCPHYRVYLQYRTIVQINSQTGCSNSSQFSWLLVV